MIFLDRMKETKNFSINYFRSLIYFAQISDQLHN